MLKTLHRTRPTTRFNARGEVVVSGQGDEEAAVLYITVGDGVSPADPTAAANDASITGRFGAVDTGVKITTGNEAFVKIVAADAAGELGPVTETRQARRISPFHRDTSDRFHSGDTLETTLETITVPAGVLGTDGEFTLELALGTLGTNGTKTARVKWGGTTIASVSIGTGVQNVFLRIKISNDGSDSSQRSMGFWIVDSSGTMDVINTDTSVDTSSDADIVITGELANSSDSITLRTTIAKLGGTL